MKKTVTLGGNVQIDVYKNDALSHSHIVHNLITLSGRNIVRDLLRGGGTPLDRFAVGTGGTFPTPSDVGLENEKYRDLITQMTPESGLLRVRMYLPSTAANGFTLTEAGLFAAGVLFARMVHPPEVKNAATGIMYSWNIIIGAIG